MFQRTVSFWKRLLGRQSPPQAFASVAEDERRVWVRYPADLETTYQPSGAGQAARLSARVRNVSLGGVSLTVDRAFQPGDLLSVELPGATEATRCNVLACVVHVGQAAPGEWVVGCTFARDLGEEDLEAFGARRVRHDPPDQRTWMRFPSDVQVEYRQVGEAEAGGHAAGVLNLSASGVSLLVPEAVENGTLLSVELRAAARPFTRTMLACVVHVNARPDGQWVLGCNFIRSLSEEDMKALL
jgi:hypothetical protein